VSGIADAHDWENSHAPELKSCTNAVVGQLPAVRGGLAGWKVRRVIAFIEANMGSSIRPADLARIVHLSTSHLFRAFKESFGETPRAYITRQRMRYAQAKMLNSRDPLSKIALECGMYDQAHFSRVFRRIVGVNPRAWRRQFPREPDGTFPQ
jgi:AraC family transcriptional regulator